MTRDDLLRLATRLLQGPAPTSQKKVYGYRGEIATWLKGLPHALMLPTRVTDACKRDALPAQAERIPAYIREHMAGHIRDLQRGRHASIVVIQEAVLLARFHVPLSFLYDLTGDAHALVLHLDTTPHLTGWMLPSYIHYDPEASASYLEQALGGQFISDDRREEA